jgi:hypothetical protein
VLRGVKGRNVRVRDRHVRRVCVCVCVCACTRCVSPGGRYSASSLVSSQ